MKKTIATSEKELSLETTGKDEKLVLKIKSGGNVENELTLDKSQVEEFYAFLLELNYKNFSSLHDVILQSIQETMAEKLHHFEENQKENV